MKTKNTKKTKLVNTTKILIVLSLIASLILIVMLTFKLTGLGNKSSKAYEVEEHFICSDYCPGPKEEYTKKVYKGVTKKDECDKIGGKYYTYMGWGETSVCLVK